MKKLKKIICFSLIVICFAIFLHYRITHTFTPKRWAEIDVNERNKISKNLLNQNILIGKTKDEVINLLGVPSSEPWFSKWKYTNSTFYYHLGYFGLQDVLVIQFNSDNIAYEAEQIARDL